MDARARGHTARIALSTGTTPLKRWRENVGASVSREFATWAIEKQVGLDRTDLVGERPPLEVAEDCGAADCGGLAVVGLGGQHPVSTTSAPSQRAARTRPAHSPCAAGSQPVQSQYTAQGYHKASARLVYSWRPIALGWYAANCMVSKLRAGRQHGVGTASAGRQYKTKAYHVRTVP